MNKSVTVQWKFHINRSGRGARKEVRDGVDPLADLPVGRVPRVARLMALALRFEEFLQQGAVADYAELARLGHVTRARITQIMNLLLLAPDIQEAILFLPRTERGRDCLTLAELQPIAAALDWATQRRMWQSLLSLRVT